MRQSVGEDVGNKRPGETEGVEKTHVRKAEIDWWKSKDLCQGCVEKNGPTQIHGCHLPSALDHRTIILNGIQTTRGATDTRRSTKNAYQTIGHRMPEK